MAGKVYTPEQAEFLLSRCELMTGQELTDLFNQTFNENKKRKSVLDFVVRHGKHCKMPTTWGCEFTKEQEEFIHQNAPKMYRKELVLALNAAFGKEFNYNTVRTYCSRHKLFAPGGDGRFNSDSHNWQKGLSKEEFKAHYSKESYQKMIQPMLESNKKYKIGDVVVKHNRPYVVISTDYGIDFESRLKKQTIYVWEQHYGPVPEHHIIINLDGDPFNCDISNLRCIPAKYRTYFRHNKWWTSHPAVKDVAIKYCELTYALKEQEVNDC